MAVRFQYASEKSDTEYKIVVEDNGVGVNDEKLEKLRTTPHYMMSDSGTTEPRRGLGLFDCRADCFCP